MGLAKAKDCRRVVFEVDMPEEMVEPDNSCENMEYAVMSTENIDPKYITRYWIDSEDLSYFKCYFGGLILDRDLAYEVDFNSVERAMIKAITKGNASCQIFEALSDLQWNAVEVVLNELTTV